MYDVQSTALHTQNRTLTGTVATSLSLASKWNVQTDRPLDKGERVCLHENMALHSP